MRALTTIFATALVFCLAGPAADAGSANIAVACGKANVVPHAPEYSSQRRRWRRNCFGNQGRCMGVWERGRRVIVCCR